MHWYKVDLLPAIKRFFQTPSNSQAVEQDSASHPMEHVDEIPSVNPQLACPLFSRIPGEIRNYIFELALTSFDDKTRPYKKGAFYYRPDFRYAQRIDTALLLTCRRIHAETEDIPARINEHTSWFYRPPPDVRKNEFSILPNAGAVTRRRLLRTIHLFAQQYWLESQFQRFTKGLGLKFTYLAHLKITLRHTDWW